MQQNSKALLILQERLVHAAQENKQQLCHAAASFQQQLVDARAASAEKTATFQERLVQQMCWRRELLLLGACMSAWCCQHHLQQRQMERVRMRSLVVLAWHRYVCDVRSERQELQAAVLRGWRQHTRRQAAVAGRIKLVQQRHTRRLMLAWQQLSTAQQQWETQSLAWADKWHSKRRLYKCHSSWRQLSDSKQQRVQLYREQKQPVVARQVLQDWHACVQKQRCDEATAQQLQHAAAAHDSRQLLRTWTAWHQHTANGICLASKHRQQRLLHIALHTWLALPDTNLRLRAISVAVSRVYSQLLQGWGYRAFSSSCSEAVAAKRLARHCLRGWCVAADVSARQRHKVQARLAARTHTVLQRCFSGWRHNTWQACRRAAAVRQGELQASLTCMSAQLDTKQAQLSLLRLHQQQLVDLVKVASRSTASSGAGHSLVPSLQWQRLECDLQLQPRARHAAFALPALQPQQPQCLEVLVAPPAAANSCSSVGAEPLAASGLGQPPVAVLGCVAVFGGVAAGGSWLSDVNLLVLVEGSKTQQSCFMVSVPVPQMSAGAGSGSRIQGRPLPLPVCDFAACECGPAAFVVAGGFDGSNTTMQLQRCTLVCCPHNSQQPAAAPTAEEWVQSWGCTWEVLQPRTQRSPAGRCHHSCSWHADSQSLVVFGGYSNSRGAGCLDDVAVFNMLHMEWWCPEHAGVWPCCRRSHAAVVLGSSLFVHGGLDSGGSHLADLWSLDLNTWRWTQLSDGKGGPRGPAARRAHCLVAAQHHFLLLHGGYSGTHELLHDAWVFDTHRQCWLPSDIAGDQPMARALHSVTHVSPGRFLVAGGQSALGPLSHVGVLASPSVLQAERLQRESLQQQLDLLRLGEERAELEGQLKGCQARMAQAQVERTASTARAAAADGLAASLASDVSTLHKALKASQAEVSAAQARAAAAAETAATLQRRLQRARHGGLQALHAASQAAAQLQQLA